MTAKKTKPAALTVAAEAAKTADAIAAGGDAPAVDAATGATKPRRGGKGARPGDTATPARKPRTDTKQSRLVAMLQAKDGATVDEIAIAFGWQAHTVRGALYGALKTKLGLAIVSEKIEGRGRVYRIGS